MTRKKAEPVKVRTLRHWKQQFDPGAKFIWRRNGKYGGVEYTRGEPVKDGTITDRRKLEMLWTSGRIELAQFETPRRTKARSKISSPSREEPLKTKEEYALYRRGIAVGMSDADAKAHARGQKPASKAKKPTASKANKATTSKRGDQSKATASKTDPKEKSAEESASDKVTAGKAITTGGGIRPPTEEEAAALREAALAEANLADI